eukprot:TRINITY_DN34127_c0_g1_i1.p1 TRINITY_DN34127_c0_g1~~TRINITY_DN34127_c0_g1_i1.p1  ORF type:complete len:993 (+),score=162.44 TRINITY_DN34127_c0_g1_i1:124-3102(+)
MKQPNKDVQQSVDTLLRYIEKDVRKIQVFKQLPFYVMFVLVLALTQSLESRGWGESAELYYRSQAMKVEFNYEEFQQVKSGAAFWDWLGKSTQAIWKNSANIGDKNFPEDPNQLLSFVIVRQFRAHYNESECRSHGTEVIPHSIKKFLRQQCTRKYDDDHEKEPIYPVPNNGLPFPVNPPPWTTNDGGGGPRQITSIPVTGELTTYSDVGSAYTLYFTNKSPISDILLDIQSLSKSGWIDISTRALIVEAITYNGAVGAYLLNSFLIEVSTSNVWLASSHPTRFLIFSLKDTPSFPFLLAMHIVLCLYIVWDSIKTIVTVVKNNVMVDDRKFTANIRFWGVLQIASTMMLMWGMYYRLFLWIDGSHMTDSDYIKQNRAKFEAPGRTTFLVDSLTIWQALVDYSWSYAQSQSKMAMANALCWLRFFGFLQYNSRLGVLTETLSSAVSTIISMIIIFTSIMLGFSIGGHILWDTVADFRSLGMTVTTLLLTAPTGDMKSYGQMEIKHSWWTPIFVAAYLTLTLLVVLNLMVSIITGSFQMVQDAMQKDHSWSPLVLWKDFSRFCKQQMEEWKNKCQAGCFSDDEDDDLDDDFTTQEQETEDGVTTPRFLSTTVNLNATTTSQTQSEQTKLVKKERKNGVYINKRYMTFLKLKQHAQQKIDNGEADTARDVALSVDEFTKLMRAKSTDPASNKTVLDEVQFPAGVPEKIFHKASTEIRASAMSIKINDVQAEKIMFNMTELSSHVPRITGIQKDTEALQILCSNLHGCSQDTSDFEHCITEVYKQQSKSSKAGITLFKHLQLVEALLHIISKMETQQANLIMGGNKTHELALQASSLKDRVSNMINKLDSKCQALHNAIVDGAEYNIPTSMLSQDHPVVLESSKGVGVVDVVQKHGYQRTKHDTDNTLEAIRMGPVGIDLSPPKQKKAKKLVSPKVSPASPRTISPFEDDESYDTDDDLALQINLVDPHPADEGASDLKEGDVEVTLQPIDVDDL